MPYILVSLDSLNACLLPIMDLFEEKDGEGRRKKEKGLWCGGSGGCEADSVGGQSR